MSFIDHSIPARTTLLSAAAPAVFLVIATAATLVTPGYSSIELTMSQLAANGRPHPSLIRFGFISYGLLVQGLGPALYALSGRGLRGLIIWVLVMVYGIGGVLAGIFVTGEHRIFLWGVTEDDFHAIAAWLTFLTIAALMTVTTWLRRDDPSSAVWRSRSSALLIVTLVAMILFVLIPSERGISGILQRTFFATTMLWVFVTSLHVRSTLRSLPR